MFRKPNTAERQNMTCKNCGAECPAETSFCRQCGAPIASEQTTAILNQTRSRRPILIGAVVVAIVGLVTAATLLGMRSHSAASSDLIYPGATTVVDMTSDGGGRALHLQTPDPMAKVEAWYQKTLKPDKTMRLTSTSVVLKNAKTTATIAAEDNTTNILIKIIN
jgi:zinc ribbon protein